MADLCEYLAERLHEHQVHLLAMVRSAASLDHATLLGQLLADVDGKTVILRMHRSLWPDDGDPVCGICGDSDMEIARGPWPCMTLRALALPFAAAPGFDPVWRLPAGLITPASSREPI